MLRKSKTSAQTRYHWWYMLVVQVPRVLGCLAKAHRLGHSGRERSATRGHSMAKVVTGSGNIVAGDATMNHDVSATSLFHSAEEFFTAVDFMSARMSAAPFGFAAAQCLELALKAYLMKNAGMTEEALIKKVGHDIAKAWSLCVSAGLGLDASVPDWVEPLARGHERPYVFRYGRDNTGIALSPIHIKVGLVGVLKAVQAATGLRWVSPEGPYWLRSPNPFEVDQSR